MIFYGLLKKLTLKWEIDPEGILQNDLLSGEGDIKSTALITDLTYLAKEIEKDQKLTKAMIDASAETASFIYSSYWSAKSACIPATKVSR